MPEIDLETGKVSGEEKKRRVSASGKGGSGSTRRAETGVTKIEADLHKRLTETLERIVEQLQVRGDEELAIAIDEDKAKMAAGLVSLTRAVTPLRKPLLIFLGFVEPVMAFGRVGAILFRRAVERRQRKIAEWEAAQAAQGEPGTQEARAYANAEI